MAASSKKEHTAWVAEMHKISLSDDESEPETGVRLSDSEPEIEILRVPDAGPRVPDAGPTLPTSLPSEMYTDTRLRRLVFIHRQLAEEDAAAQSTARPEAESESHSEPETDDEFLDNTTTEEGRQNRRAGKQRRFSNEWPHEADGHVQGKQHVPNSEAPATESWNQQPGPHPGTSSGYWDQLGSDANLDDASHDGAWDTESNVGTRHPYPYALRQMLKTGWQEDQPLGLSTPGPMKPMGDEIKPRPERLGLGCTPKIFNIRKAKKAKKTKYEEPKFDPRVLRKPMIFCPDEEWLDRHPAARNTRDTAVASGQDRYLPALCRGLPKAATGFRLYNFDDLILIDMRRLCKVTPSREQQDPPPAAVTPAPSCSEDLASWRANLPVLEYAQSEVTDETQSLGEIDPATASLLATLEAEAGMPQQDIADLFESHKSYDNHGSDLPEDDGSSDTIQYDSSQYNAECMRGNPSYNAECMRGDLSVWDTPEKGQAVNFAERGEVSDCHPGIDAERHTDVQQQLIMQILADEQAAREAAAERQS
ncbi:hypothetical protein LTR36_007976 [Oleoguttula mirabilis]|uniref:G-patch domain-containing protein n=1 Tax=Oleoguttula mirabilis TaxID=1507867 RepID=A0AAV9J9T9_9PEZI|nr:hypothetical protein LTR36_007976 [Oleoguttula mirabilis]